MRAMEILAIAALVLLGLGLLGFVLVRRLDRLEGRLQRLAALDALVLRVEDLAAHVEQRQIGGALAARLTEFGEEHARLTAAVRDLEQRLPAPGGARTRSPPPDLGERVRRQLGERGFETVTLLTDLTTLAERSGRVTFEARRRGVMHKGHVVLRDGEVVDAAHRAAYSAFP